MVLKALYPALLVFVFTSVFTFIIVYEYEILSYLYPGHAVIKLHIPFAAGFSSMEKLILNIIIVAVPTIPALATFIFEYLRIKNN